MRKLTRIKRGIYSFRLSAETEARLIRECKSLWRVELWQEGFADDGGPMCVRIRPERVHTQRQGVIAAEGMFFDGKA